MRTTFSRLNALANLHIYKVLLNKVFYSTNKSVSYRFYGLYLPVNDSLYKANGSFLLDPELSPNQFIRIKGVYRKLYKYRTCDRKINDIQMIYNEIYFFIN